MKRFIGYFIILPTVALSCLGNFGLYGDKDSGMCVRNIVVLCVALGIELALVQLTHEAATASSRKGRAGRATVALMLFLLGLSATGQYCYLLKGAVGHEVKLEDATARREDSGPQKEALRAEITSLGSALDAERSKGGWGGKCDKIAARVDATKHELAELEAGREAATAVVAGTSEFLVACAEFNLPVRPTVKIAVAVFVLVANLAGFWMLFLATLSELEREREDVLSDLRSVASALLAHARQGEGGGHGGIPPPAPSPSGPAPDRLFIPPTDAVFAEPAPSAFRNAADVPPYPKAARGDGNRRKVLFRGTETLMPARR